MSKQNLRVNGAIENERLRKARVWVLGFTQQAEKRRGGRTWWVRVALQPGGARGDNSRRRRGERAHRT